MAVNGRCLVIVFPQSSLVRTHLKPYRSLYCLARWINEKKGYRVHPWGPDLNKIVQVAEHCSTQVYVHPHPCYLLSGWHTPVSVVTSIVYIRLYGSLKPGIGRTAEDGQETSTGQCAAYILWDLE